jgi:pilus assembly protein CpaB
MNLKTWIPLALAIVLGLVAAKVAKDSLGKGNKPVAQSNLQEIVVAADGLPPGHEITAADLTIGHVDPASVPEQSFTTPAAVLGRTVQIEMTKGQAIVEPLLADSGAGSGLQALVPAGLRAITIEVNEFSGLANMVAPGCRVDVVATIQPSGGEEMISRTIVQDVKVTAVGNRVTRNIDPKDDAQAQQQQQAFRSVTLLCTPEEAETIQLANTTGRPWLVLRGGKDDDKVETPGITLASLRGKAGAPAHKDPFIPVATFQPTTQPSNEVAMNTRQVEVIRGGAASMVTIQLPSIQDSDAAGGNDTYAK